MNAPVLTYPLQGETPPAFPDLTLVRPATTDEGEEIPAGSEGTVVAVYARGAAYEFEFQIGLATVEATAIEAI